MVKVKLNKFELLKGIGCFFVVFYTVENVQAQNIDLQESFVSSKQSFKNIIIPKSKTEFNQVNINELSQFQVHTANSNALPIITPSDVKPKALSRVNVFQSNQVPRSFNHTIAMALQRSPAITEALAKLSGEGSKIDVARAGYYPQISGGLSTEDYTNKQGYGQVWSIDAKQMVFDFGKVKSDVNVAEAKLSAVQAEALIKIDEVAYDTAIALTNLKRYQSLAEIAKQQLKGLSSIAEITKLRAAAGISTQADPVQAQTYLQQAESTLINQQNQLQQYEQTLRTLIGTDPALITFSIPQNIVVDSKLFDEPKYNRIPKLMAAQSAVSLANLEKQQTKLSSYPTLSLRGSLSQAMNGKNPSNNEENGSDSLIKLEVSSNFFQGGAITARNKAAAFSEQAAKAQVSAAYLEVQDELSRLREEVKNKEKLLAILVARKQTTVRTRELYQEQYKLGTRSAVDLLNAEQAIHGAAQEIENARYDIYGAIIKYLSVTGKSYDVYQLNNTSIQGFTIKP